MRKKCMLLVLSALLMTGCGASANAVDEARKPILEQLELQQAQPAETEDTESTGQGASFKDSLAKKFDKNRLVSELVDDTLKYSDSMRFIVEAAYKNQDETFHTKVGAIAGSLYFRTVKTTETVKNGVKNVEQCTLLGTDTGKEVFVANKDYSTGDTQIRLLDHSIRQYCMLLQYSTPFVLFDTDLFSEYTLEEADGEYIIRAKIPLEKIKEVGILVETTPNDNETFDSYSGTPIYFDAVYTFDKQSKSCKQLDISICKEFYKEHNKQINYRENIEFIQINSVDLSAVKREVDLIMEEANAE